jgi:hypothetical protein
MQSRSLQPQVKSKPGKPPRAPLGCGLPRLLLQLPRFL